MSASSLKLDDITIRNNIKFVQKLTRAINKHLQEEGGSCEHLLVEVLRSVELEYENSENKENKGWNDFQTSPTTMALTYRSMDNAGMVTYSV